MLGIFTNRITQQAILRARKARAEAARAAMRRAQAELDKADGYGPDQDRYYDENPDALGTDPQAG